MGFSSWSFSKARLRLALGIMGVVMAAIAGIAPQKALAAGRAQHPRSYFLYVGTYTGPNSKGIYLFRFDESTGHLTSLGLAAQIGNPSWITVSPNHHYLYALTEMPSHSANTPRPKGPILGTVSSFAINPKTGALKFLNRTSTGGVGPAYVGMDNTGKMLFVANYGSGSVASYSILPNGSIGAMTAFGQHRGHSVNPERQRYPHAHEAVVSPDNRFLYTPDLGLDRIFIYSIDYAKRSFTPNHPPYAAVTPGLGPRHIVFSPNRKFAYVVCEMGASVVALSYHPANGSLTPVQTISILPSDFTGVDQGSEIQIDRSGRYLYASNQGPNDNPDLVDGRITVFQIDAKTGLLKQIQVMSTGGKLARNFVLDPSGKYLLAGNDDSNSITVFTIAANGKIAPTKQAAEVGSPTALLFVPAP